MVQQETLLTLQKISLQQASFTFILRHNHSNYFAVIFLLFFINFFIIIKNFIEFQYNLSNFAENKSINSNKGVNMKTIKSMKKTTKDCGGSKKCGGAKNSLKKTAKDCGGAKNSTKKTIKDCGGSKKCCGRTK